MKDLEDMLRPKLSPVPLDQPEGFKQEGGTCTFVFQIPSDGGEA